MDGFIVINKIGEGSFSSVLKVKRKVDNNIYALKRVKYFKLNDKEKSNALNEIRILASINNQNIISYKEAFFDEKDSSLNIVMEYADQGDLFQKITEYKKNNIHFTEEEIWNTLIQLLKGLKSLHDLNILHRDIKSANVFLFNGGTVKLGDLNVSKVTRKGLGYTQTGTPYYASPEVWKDKPYDSKSDIWSLGCVIYEMASLNPPFRADDMDHLYKKVIRGFYPDISNKYSKDLSEVIKLMIQIEVGARPSCEELLNMPIITKRMEKRNEINSYNKIEEGNKSLLRTIRVSQNINSLSRNLPKPNYYLDNNINSFRDNLKNFNGFFFNNIKESNQRFNIVNNNIILKNINILKIDEEPSLPHYHKKNIFNEKYKNNMRRNVSLSPIQIKNKMQNPYVNRNYLIQKKKLILPELIGHNNNISQIKRNSKIKIFSPINNNKINIINKSSSNNNYNNISKKEIIGSIEDNNYNGEIGSVCKNKINNLNKKNLNIKMIKKMNIKNVLSRNQSPKYNYRIRNKGMKIMENNDNFINYGNLKGNYDNFSNRLNNGQMKLIKNKSNNNIKNHRNMIINLNS